VILKIDFEKAYDSVDWDFVKGILKRKELPKQMVDWIMSTVRGGGCVLISMEKMAPISKHTGGLGRETHYLPCSLT